MFLLDKSYYVFSFVVKIASHTATINHSRKKTDNVFCYFAFSLSNYCNGIGFQCKTKFISLIDDIFNCT